jgi:hypothetical protein
MFQRIGIILFKFLTEFSLFLNQWLLLGLNFIQKLLKFIYFILKFLFLNFWVRELSFELLILFKKLAQNVLQLGYFIILHLLVLNFRRENLMF